MSANKAYKVSALFFLLSIAPFFGKLFENENVKPIKTELYNSDLYYINSIDKAIKYTDSIYLKNNYQNFDTSEYVQIVSEFTKERFYKGLSLYNMSNNWIACMAGKLTWSHLSAIVNPNDILKHSEGLCSQQTIVFMEILMRKGIDVRSVGLGCKGGPGHFMSEAHYKGLWHLHDVTMEPVWEQIFNNDQSMEFYLKNKESLYSGYKRSYGKPFFNKLLRKVIYGKTNEFAAKKMLLFHQISLLLTYLIPLFLLSITIRSFVKVDNIKNKSV